MQSSDGAVSSGNSSNPDLSRETKPLQEADEFSQNENSWTSFTLTKDKIDELRRIFEDFTPSDGNTFEDILAALAERNTVAFEIPRKGLAIATNVVPRYAADVSFYMFDRQLRGRAPLFLRFVAMLFEQFKLIRVTMTFPAYRPMAKIAERMGFTKEGELRDAGPRGEGISIYGMLASELRVGDAG